LSLRWPRASVRHGKARAGDPGFEYIDRLKAKGDDDPLHIHYMEEVERLLVKAMLENYEDQGVLIE